MNPPIIPSIRSAFSVVIPDPQRVPEMTGLPVMQAHYLLRPIPNYPKNWNNVQYEQQSFSVQTQIQHEGH